MLRLDVLQEFAAERSDGVLLFLLSDEQGIVCAAVAEPRPSASVVRPVESLLYGRAQPLTDRLGLRGEPYLRVGAPWGQDSGVMLRRGVEGAMILGRFVDALENWTRDAGMGLVFHAVHEDEKALSGLLRERHYLRTKRPSGTLLPVRWRSFEEYRAAMTKRSSRVGETLRAERRRNRDGGVVIRRTAPSAAQARALHGFADHHFRYKNDSDLPYGDGFLERLLPRLQDDVLLLEAVRDGQCCAMLAVVKSGDTGWAAFFGLDTRDRPNDFTYFNIVFYALADYAADFGLRQVLMGNGAYAAKQRRGCELRPAQLFYRPRTALRRQLLRPVFALHRHWAAGKFT
jgi:predicted N-acyltransferase